MFVKIQYHRSSFVTSRRLSGTAMTDIFGIVPLNANYIVKIM